MKKWQFRNGGSTEDADIPRAEVYIGAHDYLVLVAAAPPPPSPPQTTRSDDQGTASSVGVEPPESASGNRISTIHSTEFRYGKVEVRAKVSSKGLSGFWLVPSEIPALGHTPCARVAIAEVRNGVVLLLSTPYAQEVIKVNHRSDTCSHL